MRLAVDNSARRATPLSVEDQAVLDSGRMCEPPVKQRAGSWTNQVIDAEERLDRKIWPAKGLSSA